MCNILKTADRRVKWIKFVVVYFFQSIHVIVIVLSILIIFGIHSARNCICKVLSYLTKVTLGSFGALYKISDKIAKSYCSPIFHPIST